MASDDTSLPGPPPQRETQEECSNALSGGPAKVESATKPDVRQKRVCVARIGAAHGVRGEVKIWSFTADPGAVARYQPLESAAGERFTIEALRPGKGFFIARLKGVANRDAAAQLNNVELFVPRERLPAVEAADEFYHADLIGLAVVDCDGAELGRIVAVQNFGAGDLIEMAPVAGGETMLLPFTEDVVPEVNISAGRIVVIAPTELGGPEQEADAEIPAPFKKTSTAQGSGG